jgi:hypothetical protein
MQGSSRPLGGLAEAVGSQIPCMPCHPHRYTKPYAALLGAPSALLEEVPGQDGVVGREAVYGIIADNLLTAFFQRELGWPVAGDGMGDAPAPPPTHQINSVAGSW